MAKCCTYGPTYMELSGSAVDAEVDRCCRALTACVCTCVCGGGEV